MSLKPNQAAGSQVDDGPSYDLACPCSFADSFRRQLNLAIAPRA